MSFRDGSRKVELFIPFKSHAGQEITEITLAPVTLETFTRWQEGRFETALALLADLAGLPLTTVQQIRYPDADRVMAEFGYHLPLVIREDVENGRIPIPSPEVARAMREAPDMTDSPQPPLRAYSHVEPDSGGFDMGMNDGRE